MEQQKKEHIVDISTFPVRNQIQMVKTNGVFNKMMGDEAKWEDIENALKEIVVLSPEAIVALKNKHYKK